MRLRSGLDMYKSDSRLGVDPGMEDENCSTRAEKGTPSASQSSSFTTNEHSQASISPVPEEPSTSAKKRARSEESAQDQGERDESRTPRPSHMDNFTTPIPVARQLQTPGGPMQPYSGEDIRSLPPPRLQLDSLQTPPQTEDSIRRYHNGPMPWSPTTPTDPEGHKRMLSNDIPDIHEYPRDRNYPDKMETALIDLEQGKTDEALPRDGRRRAKRPRRDKKSFGTRSTDKGKEREHDNERGDGPGANGSGQTVAS